MIEPVLPASSGIYKITCTVNKKIYIGSAVNLQQRRRLHWSGLKRNEHHNPHLQNAWNKYGEQSFTFEVLEFVLPVSLTAREQYWFNKLKPFGREGFNIAIEAGSSFGLKQTKPGYIRTPEIRERARQTRLGKKASLEQIKNQRQSHLGKPSNRRGKTLSPEHIEKIRQAKLGQPSPNRGKKASLETRKRQSQAKLGRRQAPEQVEKTRQIALTRTRVKGRFV